MAKKLLETESAPDTDEASQKNKHRKTPQPQPTSAGQQHAERLRCIQNALSSQLRARLTDSSRLSVGRSSMLRTLIQVCAEEQNEVCRILLPRMLTELLKQATAWATRLGWYQLWTAASPILIAAALRDPQDCELLTAVCRGVVLRTEFAQNNEQADTIRAFETAWTSASSPSRLVLLQSAVRIVDECAPKLTSGWRAIFRLVSRAASDPALFDVGANVARSTLESCQDLLVDRRATVDAVSCLMGFACAPFNIDVSRDLLVCAARLTQPVCTVSHLELFVSVAVSSGIEMSVRAEAVQHANALALRCAGNPIPTILGLVSKIGGSTSDVRTALAPFICAGAWGFRADETLRSTIVDIVSAWVTSTDDISPWVSFLEQAETSTIEEHMRIQSRAVSCKSFWAESNSNDYSEEDARSLIKCVAKTPYTQPADITRRAFELLDRASNTVGIEEAQDVLKTLSNLISPTTPLPVFVASAAIPSCWKIADPLLRKQLARNLIDVVGSDVLLPECGALAVTLLHRLSDLDQCREEIDAVPRHITMDFPSKREWAQWIRAASRLNLAVDELALSALQRKFAS